MSQPVGLTLKVSMSAEVFKKYIKAEAGNIAWLIFDLRDKSEEEDYYYLKYNKRFQTFYAYIYYNHGNQQWLEQSPFLPVLMNVEQYLDADSEGYLLATFDASSPWRADKVAFSTDIRQGKYTNDSITPEQLRRVKKDCDAFFRQAANGYFYEMLDAGEPVLEKAIATRYEKLKEQQRLHTIKQSLHTATPENPLTLFGNWKYDGTNLLGYNGKKYPQFDIPNLRETPYGVTDGRYVLALTYNDVTHEWYELLLETDPDKFRIMRKGEGTVYYKSADMVYNWKFEPMPGADAATFKVLSPFHARDKNNIYTYGGGMQDTIIPLRELGEPYTFEPDAFNRWDRLIVGQKQMWVGRFRIDGVDAATFEQLPYTFTEAMRELLRGGWTYVRSEYVLHGRDREGEFFLTISIQHTEGLYGDLIPRIPELPINTPILMRCGPGEFESWYLRARGAFRREIERLHKQKYGG